MLNGEGYAARRGICKLFKSSAETKGFNIVRFANSHPLIHAVGSYQSVCNNTMSEALRCSWCAIYY